jgi:hypothetical protein
MSFGDPAGAEFPDRKEHDPGEESPGSGEINKKPTKHKL